MRKLPASVAAHTAMAANMEVVGRVLMKLGLRDRVQAVIFAYEVGVVSPGS